MGEVGEAGRGWGSVVVEHGPVTGSVGGGGGCRCGGRTKLGWEGGVWCLESGRGWRWVVGLGCWVYLTNPLPVAGEGDEVGEGGEGGEGGEVG